jgi:DNA-binding NarL/FixJ family response regulator
MAGINAENDKKIRVVVADDQRLVRDGIASLLSIQEGIEVVGTASNGEEAVIQALELRPDVTLMDIRMPIMDGVEATRRIRRELPGCQVLMLTTFDDEEYVLEALKAGACGYLLKDIPAHDLASAIKAAHQGIYQLDPGVAGKMLLALSADKGRAEPAHGAPTSATNTVADLSAREIEVLRLIAKGASNREIAEHLVISEGTVKNHISNILNRLGLRDRTQAAIYAREAGLL